MREIRRYEILQGRSQVMIPVGGKILRIGYWKSAICIWAEVDPESPTSLTTFRIVPTEMTFDPFGLRFIETILMQDAQCVFHVYLEESAP